jgi:hypothetical protein
MATAAPSTPPVAYGEVATKGGVNSVSVEQEVILPQSSAAPGQKTIPITVKIRPAMSARPQRSVLFGALTDPKLRLRKAIPLEVSTEESAIVLTWAAIDEFGCGETLGEALDNFGAALLELHHRLHEPVQLGPDLENVKHILDKYIELRTQR